LDGEGGTPIARVTKEDEDPVIGGICVRWDGHGDVAIGQREVLCDGRRLGQTAATEIDRATGVGDLRRLLGGVPGDSAVLASDPDGACIRGGDLGYPDVTCDEWESGDDGEDRAYEEEAEHHESRKRVV